MDIKQDFTLKRNASDTFDSEDEDSSGAYKKSRLSKITVEDKTQKSTSSAIVERKDGVSPTPKKARITSHGHSPTIIPAYRTDLPIGNFNSSDTLPASSRDGKRVRFQPVFQNCYMLKHVAIAFVCFILKG